jgi:hypothetical protein
MFTNHVGFLLYFVYCSEEEELAVSSQENVITSILDIYDAFA